jgi:hypothetical protein
MGTSNQRKRVRKDHRGLLNYRGECSRLLKDEFVRGIPKSHLGNGKDGPMPNQVETLIQAVGVGTESRIGNIDKLLLLLIS